MAATRFAPAICVLALIAFPAAAAGLSAQAKQGEHLVLVLGCHDCHTPFKMGPNGPEPDMARMLSGHPENLVLPPPPPLNEVWNNVGAATNTAFSGPWGITYTINLTPDPDTGMGKWREQDFVKAIKTGKHLGMGREIQPPMPWPWYRHLTEAELKAIYAYLKTIPPIKNRVPDWVPPASK
jgi:mono/diheme cytochrome c family protein